MKITRRSITIGNVTTLYPRGVAHHAIRSSDAWGWCAVAALICMIVCALFGAQPEAGAAAITFLVSLTAAAFTKQ